MATSTSENFPKIEFKWILSKNKDLAYYIGSALIGYLYLFIIIYGIMTLNNPMTDSFFTLGKVNVNLNLLVVLSWGILLDAPHLFATLARTVFDPDEWKTRKGYLIKSWMFFFLGPVMIITPYLIGWRFNLSAATMALGYFIFIVFFRLWAYYHVVRQHWGFFRLYKRKTKDYDYERLDYWFFQISMYVPLLLFLTSAYYPNSGSFPNLGLRSPIIGSYSIGYFLYPILWSVYLVIILYYVFYQFKLYRSGVTLNGSKLLYMSMIIPLHLLAFSNPILALFVTPLVTVGHNIQYHMIVYSYGKKKYYNNAVSENELKKNYKWPRFFFKNIFIYFAFGLIFTLLLYRGPLFDGLSSFVGLRVIIPNDLNRAVFNSVGMMAGVVNPGDLGLGELVFGSFLLGWAMQHYYLDSKIWRVSKDVSLQKNLNL